MLFTVEKQNKKIVPKSYTQRIEKQKPRPEGIRGGECKTKIVRRNKSIYGKKLNMKLWREN